MTIVASLDEVRSWVNATDSGDDAVLTALQQRMVDTFERLTGVGLKELETGVQRTYDGTGHKTLYLVSDTQSVSSVETRTTFSGDWDDLVDDFANDIELSAQGPFLARLDGGIFPRGHKNIRVTFDKGFEDVPGDIVQAILEMIETKYRGRMVEIPSIVTGEGSAEANIKEFSDHTKRTIRRYRYGVGY